MQNFEALPVRKRPENKQLAKLLPRWQNNTSPLDLGIVRFAFDLFSPEPLKREYGTADWVRPTLYKILRYKPGIIKIDRAWAICTSRDYSKTTWISYILPLYLMLVGQYGIYWTGEDGKPHLLPEADFIRLRAKNQEKAEEKLGNVTVEFSNEKVVNLFGDLQPTIKEIRDKKLKNQAKMMILKNGYIFQALGLNQAARGANIRGRRPKVDIDDDVENKENTKSISIRRYNAKEILGEQFGGLAMDGLTVYIGNYVHQECILAKLMKPNSGWNRLFFQASYIDEMGIERSGWEKRFPLPVIKRLEEWYKNQPDLGGYKTFRMEYYNEIISEKDYEVKYYKGRYFYKDGKNFIELLTDEGKKEVHVFVVVSGDPAISTNVKSSDGVSSVIGFGADGNRYVMDVSLGKFDIRDRFYNEEKKPRIIALTPEEMGNVKRKGLVDEIVRHILRYHANAFVLENAGQQLAWYNDVKEILKRLNLDYIPGLPYHPTDEKVYKLETGLMNLIGAGRYYINENMVHKSAAVSEITTFPESKLDILDTWHNAEKIGKIPNAARLNVFNEVVEENQEETYIVPNDVEPYILF